MIRKADCLWCDVDIEYNDDSVTQLVDERSDGILVNLDVVKCDKCGETSTNLSKKKIVWIE